MPCVRIIPGWKLIPTHNIKEISDKKKIITEKKEKKLASKLCIAHIQPTAKSGSLIEYHVCETEEVAEAIAEQKKAFGDVRNVR